MRMPQRFGRELFGNLGLFFQIRKKQLDKAIRTGEQRVFDPILGKVPLIHLHKLRWQGNVPILFGLFPAVFDPHFRTVGHWFSLMGICFPLPMNRLCHLHVENFARRQPPFDHSQSDSGDFSGRKMDAKKIVDYPIDM